MLAHQLAYIMQFFDVWEWHHRITVANNKTDDLPRWGIKFALPERRGNMKP